MTKGEHILRQTKEEKGISRKKSAQTALTSYEGRGRRQKEVGRLFEQTNVQVSRKVPHNDIPVLRSAIIMERNEQIEVGFKYSCMHKHDPVAYINNIPSNYLMMRLEENWTSKTQLIWPLSRSKMHCPVVISQTLTV